MKSLRSQSVVLDSVTSSHDANCVAERRRTAAQRLHPVRLTAIGRSRMLLLPVCLLFCLWPDVAFCGHPLSITETEVYVARHSARMRIRLFAEDLYMFQGLQPDGADRIPPAELQRGLDDHQQFLIDKVQLLNIRGEPYPAKITDIQAFEIPEDGIPVESLMAHTAVYELEFPFDEPPEYLTIQQDISDANYVFPSEMKLTLHQSGTELIYVETMKPGAPQTLRFDWSGDPLSEDATEAEWESWFEKQRQATLGITTYSSVYSFIYVEPAEVRHEILLPLANLKTVLPLEHADPSFIEVSEQEAVRELLRNWLSKDNPVQVNGKDVPPEFTRIDFCGLEIRDLAVSANSQRISLANGRVGIIMTYRPESDTVRDVRLTWNTFNSALRKVQSVAITYADEMERLEFSRFQTPDENVFTWKAASADIPHAVAEVPAVLPAQPTLRLSIGTVILSLLAGLILLFSRGTGWRSASALAVLAVLAFPFAQVEFDHPLRSPPPVAAAAADDVFEQLHSNAYRSLDFGSQGRIYEALETSIDGELLEKIYLQFREGLKVKEQGGAVARVRSVDYGEGELVDSQEARWPAFRYRSRWTVSGTVEHWGHIHERQNQFLAQFHVEPKDGVWKITAMNVEDQSSHATRNRLRKF